MGRGQDSLGDRAAISRQLHRPAQTSERGGKPERSGSPGRHEPEAAGLQPAGEDLFRLCHCDCALCTGCERNCSFSTQPG